MQQFLVDLSVGSTLLLGGALVLAFIFEAINGFHDTANAVATVIYTNSLKPTQAVVWSGIWNFLGVAVSSGAVAFAIVALLPIELVIHAGSAAGFAMVFAILLSAVIWNFTTWFLGIPASSSHTLIGSIVGVGVMNADISKHSFSDGINWGVLTDLMLGLIFSPIIGFVLAGAALLLMKKFLKKRELYETPEGKKPPAWWIRGLLIFTCTGVSFAHGSNDGQKGMGLIMLILIGVLPSMYAINPMTTQMTVARLVEDNRTVQAIIDKKASKETLDDESAEVVLANYLKSGAKIEDNTLAALAYENDHIHQILLSVPTLDKLTNNDRKELRSKIYLVGASIKKMNKHGKISSDRKEMRKLRKYRTELDNITQFIPIWVKLTVALCLGIGTMIGWKRIVVTIGEKIGKSHLTYAQGASAEFITWATIQGADIFGLPVSTTHILSSGVAGTMAANSYGLQAKTLRNIIIAWVLTIPVTIFLGAGIFGAGLYVILHWIR